MTDTSRIQLATYEAGMLQAAANRNLTAFMSKALASSKITMSEWSLLGILASHGQSRPSVIASTMDVKTPMATRLLRSLATKGLVVEVKDSEDQRGKLINLSLKGKKLLNNQEIILRAGMKEYMKGVDRKDLAIYLKVLQYLALHQPN